MAPFWTDFLKQRERECEFSNIKSFKNISTFGFIAFGLYFISEFESPFIAFGYLYLLINKSNRKSNNNNQQNYNEEYKRKMFPKWLLCGLTQIPPHSVNYSKGITIKLAGVEWNGISLTSNDSPFVIKANPKLLIIFCKTGAKAKCMDSSLLWIPLCANARTFASGLLLHSENIKMVFVFGFVAALRTIFNKEFFPCATVYFIYIHYNIIFIDRIMFELKRKSYTQNRR